MHEFASFIFLFFECDFQFEYLKTYSYNFPCEGKKWLILVDGGKKENRLDDSGMSKFGTQNLREIS
jgi:hypothetical protein